MTYARMSTLGRVLSEGLEKTHFTKPISGNIDLAFDWYQRYWKYLQRSKSTRISTCLKVEHASIRAS